jgi:hypothetical protein
MRLLALPLFFAGGGLLALLHLDRKSALALTLVEKLGGLGDGVGAGLALAGVALLLLPAKAAAAPPPPAPMPKPPPAPAPTVLAPDDWLGALRLGAQALPLDRGATVEIDPSRRIPISLHARRLTIEQLRRAIDTFTGFLVEGPVPERAALFFVDCPPSISTRQSDIRAALRRKGYDQPVQVAEHGDTVELRFTAPDPRWAAPISPVPHLRPSGDTRPA